MRFGFRVCPYAHRHVALAGPSITDPIADYLAMNVPDRIANVGRLLVIKKVEVDLEGNGKNDVFVGTWYRNSGPDTWLWAGYAPTADGYERITPADSDVLIDFDGIYVGDLPDVSRHGMAQAYSLELTNKDREQSNMISDLTFYYIEDGHLAQQGTGALDRDEPEQEAKFQYYFGADRNMSGGAKNRIVHRYGSGKTRLSHPKLATVGDPGDKIAILFRKTLQRGNLDRCRAV